MVKQERAARTRRALIRAAAEVFAEEGYVSASLAAISKRAGVSNGALHFHFDNKKALAQAVEEEAVRVVRRITGEPPGGDTCALQQVVDSTHHLMRRIADDAIVRAGFELCADPASRAGCSLRWEWWRWIEDVLQRAQREGGLAEDISVENVAALIVAVTVGFEVLGVSDREWLSERRVTGFWTLMLPRLAERRTLARVSPGPARPSSTTLLRGREQAAG
ncbi:TetR/AcrR family transcriptional regulator [Streptomyces sp. K1PN6]|uniref:TetR/AcrR family transcriptional regulator n=2 Tax=Streptomyces acidicola TaxID=2596892 RepID=A0A5N8WUQ3_9ACTN|nr:TetR/AcrR family transcriptional regulator [Streptomyces acidicola]